MEVIPPGIRVGGHPVCPNPMRVCQQLPSERKQGLAKVGVLACGSAQQREGLFMAPLQQQEIAQTPGGRRGMWYSNHRAPQRSFLQFVIAQSVMRNRLASSLRKSSGTPVKPNSLRPRYTSGYTSCMRACSKTRPHSSGEASRLAASSPCPSDPPRASRRQSRSSGDRPLCAAVR
jgi:hypothetical protein